MTLTLFARRGRHVDRATGGSESRFMLKTLLLAIALALLALVVGSVVMIAGPPLVVVAVVCTLMLLGVIAVAVIIATPNSKFVAVTIATARGIPRRLEDHFYHRRHGRHVDRREQVMKYLSAIGTGHHTIGIGPVVRQ